MTLITTLLSLESTTSFNLATTRDKIITAKLPGDQTQRSTRLVPGMKKCNKPCPICPWVSEGKLVSASATPFVQQITTQLDCQSSNIIYCLECLVPRCRKQYIGETNRTLQQRFSEHKYYVTSEKLTTATGYHFNLPGHSVDDMAIMAIEKIHHQQDAYRKEMEKEKIRKFNSFYKGLNRNC